MYVAKKDDFSKVPDALVSSLGKMEFVMDLVLSPERKLAREDAGKVIDSLKAQVFLCNCRRTMRRYKSRLIVDRTHF